MIKYHDNTSGVQYGEDHTLTDNWNPDCDYGNEYVKVYFRIDTPSYLYDRGFDTEDERIKWDNEASNLIASLGILEDCGFKVEHSNDKCAYLYAHPQNISGVVRKNDVRKIAEAIDNMKLSSIRWVDLYGTVYLITDEEYEKYLHSKRAEIRKLLFEQSHTTRTTKYCYAVDVARYITNIIGLNRLGMDNDKRYGAGQTTNYILEIAKAMVEEGYLKSITDRNEMWYIRSLNKTEMKKMSLFVTGC